ncbi:type VII secretion protein EsaA [Bacillus inaquosorum]|uniref:type VII secretion protein EsaA n=1 Tax=Bacillus inaquosorum TaxID=483913 RepID=UPI00227FF78D|nr:type VII secretion protein EsaA [Bacillus inaquosorum]MCY7904055.1 type VII secretion protein EsaA [Bacillus inaquosorum]MCY7930163.1 type VII secretion protein EsaA [Bacillus inaquosorum]MCY8030034.1 type VII secretion protein EsaA [Bacillus inaquosorum]MCY8769182.1 type VII secretion protein EsaA [Bacillus inaquosorum]MCY9048986.1 type VII secretion protein EsaA [Bacillus inaquosorum]
MTEQRKSLIKLISAVIIILLLPVLFFRFIGDDPTKKAVNSTRQIAVVNEDTGVLSDEVKSDEEDKSAHFGKEVAAVLGERPDYSWTVVNRSAAETGLASKKYDAIVYIPSDFSKNILSYDKDHPRKATLEFSIQDNLNAVNKEKVQRELEDAQKTMNKKMSALYWNFVSQKVDNIRGEFDKIVNKESEFQNVMYNFYKPSSNDLAGEIKQQKDLIDELKKSMNEAQGTTKEKASTAEEAKNTLKDFIDTVERYKEYQENQKKLLLAAQDSTQQQIHTGLDAIQAQQKANQFSERMSGLSTGISQVKTQLGQTSTVLAAAQQIREGQVPQQELGMAKIQSDLIDQYQATSRQAALNQVYGLLVESRAALTVAKGDPQPDGDDGSDDEDKDPKEEDPEELKIDLEKQREELKNIAADIQDISDNLKEPEKEDPTPEDPGTEKPGTDEPSTDKPDNPDDGGSTNPDDTQGDTGNDDNSSDTGNDGQTDGNTQDQDQQQGTDGQEQNGDASNGESDSGQTETGTSAEQTASSDSALQFIKLANEDGTGDSGDTGGDGGTTQPEDEDQTGNDEISDIAKAKEQLSKASERIKQIEEELKEKETAHNEELKKKLEELKEQMDGLNDEIDDLKDQVKKLEGKLENLEAKRKREFEGIYSAIRELENKDQLQFTGEINTESISALMRYYKYLSVYDSVLSGTIDSTAKTNAIDGQQGNVKSILALSPAETASWEDLKNNMMQTDEDINSFIDGMTKFADDYSGFIRDSQAGVLDELTKISESAAKASEQLVTGATQESATFSNDGLSGTMALSVQDTVGQEVLQMSDMMGSLSDRQSGIIDYTTNMQQSVNDVQTKADTLNNNWGKNVASTKLVRNDVYGILGNTLVDGQNNGYVYDYLANPLKISGEVPEEKTQTVPPVVILVIVLISSLLIGYFSSYYQNAPLLVKGALFGILNILVGLMISLFGLNIYSLPDDQTIKWSVFTILLLVASSAFIRAAFRFGSIPGWVASAAMILFYVAPLIDLIMPNFTFEDPVSKVYIDIQYGTGHLFAMGISVLLIITVIAAALPLIIRLMAEKTAESDETYEA